jgi:hypothetical protein
MPFDPFDTINQVLEVLFIVAERPRNVLIVGDDKSVLVDLMKQFEEDYECEFDGDMCLKVENGATITAVVFNKAVLPVYGENSELRQFDFSLPSTRRRREDQARQKLQ